MRRIFWATVVLIASSDLMAASSIERIANKTTSTINSALLPVGTATFTLICLGAVLKIHPDAKSEVKQNLSYIALTGAAGLIASIVLGIVK